MRHAANGDFVFPMTLEALTVARLTGAEPFHAAGEPIGFDLLSFWRWSCSYLASNALRGVIAEYLVAQAVGAAKGVRTEWDAYDVVTAGGLKVEVKSSAYIQTWKQDDLSRISFDIAAKKGWDAATNTSATTARRSADIYVFALHAHKDKATIDPLDVTQWQFFVLSTSVLNERCPKQKTIALSSLLKLGPTKVGFAELGPAIHDAVGAASERG